MSNLNRVEFKAATVRRATELKIESKPHSPINQKNVPWRYAVRHGPNGTLLLKLPPSRVRS